MDKIKRLPEKASEAVKYIESVSYFEDNITGDDTVGEVVGISDAIRALDLAVLETLRYTLVNKPEAVNARIRALEAILQY